MGFHAIAVTFAQIDQAGLGLADFHGFKQYPFQQRLETGLGTQAVGDLEETRQGVFHARHRHAQLIDFEYRRATGHWKVEIETANRIRFLHQGAQGFDQNARCHPTQWHTQQQRCQGNQRSLPTHAVSIGEQFIFRHQQRQLQSLGATFLHAAAGHDPLATVSIQPVAFGRAFE
ncbi:hypothetical protein D3C71_522670 [compost metagenome]